MGWYLRSMADRDTHHASGVHRDGSVVAACNARFRPRLLPSGTKALPGQPPDPEQICPRCKQAQGQRR